MAAVVAVSALPVKAPTKSVEVTEVNPVNVASRLTTVAPVVGEAVRFVPPVTLVTALVAAPTTSAIVAFLTDPASASYIGTVSAPSAVAPKDVKLFISKDKVESLVPGVVLTVASIPVPPLMPAIA